MRRKKKGFLFKQNRGRRLDRTTKENREPTQCPDCGVLFINGHWTWEAARPTNGLEVCPACKRIEENDPIGFVTLSGSFLNEHRSEIILMVRDLERSESSAHPLERIIKIKETNRHLFITTTGVYLARRLGDYLKTAFRGTVNTSYDAQERIRISWKR
ncbi:BCAM0308 family protein [Aliifodinibius sp. S!AR15-10]|uniref:BCAM0308 family protein n=1 Tax=Aliifodinibius sp. S!AR15-10 TaxID=2950437 RepID=UPI00285851F6|nr:BCAM0308 family protein [Aliifodinibius sp. S!AR15-10]MDR8394007.1 BCAM0308 family protein [Aliifodinibius sp. S!AR15-10]